MKRLLFAYILYISVLQAEESYISRGGLTEALFIIHNKHNDLSDYIMRLKRMLAQCILVVKEKGKGPSVAKEVTCCHCSFKEKLFSSSIKELEELLSVLNRSLLDLSKKEQFSYSCVQAHVDQAFLIKRKIDTESLLVEHMLKIRQEKDSLERTEKSLELAIRKNDDFKKAIPASIRSIQSLRRSERTISFLKRVIARLHVSLSRNGRVIKNLQSTLREIDGELYRGHEEKRVNMLLEEVV